MCPSTTWLFSSFTRNVALGRVSTISPCICMVSSLAISARREHAPLEIRFLEQALVLVRHHVGPNLGHEIHGHHHDDEERGAAEVERHALPHDQEFRQQAYQHDV